MSFEDLTGLFPHVTLHTGKELKFFEGNVAFMRSIATSPLRRYKSPSLYRRVNGGEKVVALEGIQGGRVKRMVCPAERSEK